MEVIQRDNITATRFTNIFKGSNTYVMEFEGCCEVYLFDIGDSVDVLHFTKTRKVIGLFLTHCHFDHIFGISNLIEQHPECIIYCHPKCFEGLHNDRLNFSFYYEKPLNFIAKNVRLINNGESIYLTESILLNTIFTPGHSVDSTSYLVNKFLITGDAFIPKVPPVTKLKGGNKEQYAVSCNLIKSLINNDTILLPGHGPMFCNIKFSV